MTDADRRIYASDFVQGLFAGMAATYGVTNLVSSFGFCRRWRRQCVELASPREGMVVYDLMSGMGECWPTIARAVGASGKVVGVDFTAAMCERARRVGRRTRSLSFEVHEEDVLSSTVADGSADCVVSAFGLKTLAPDQRARFAAELARILKPGGTFSLLEISVPRPRWFRSIYMFYLERCIPRIGALFLGDPANYRLLGRYTAAFRDASSFVEVLGDHGLRVEFRRLFFGCATVVRGERPGQ